MTQIDRIENMLGELLKRMNGGVLSIGGEDAGLAERTRDVARSGGNPLALLKAEQEKRKAERRKAARRKNQ